MTARRELWLSVLLCLAGSALVLLSSARTWATLEPARLGSVPRHLNGDDLAGAAQALGYVGLAAVLALAATKRLGRVVIGLLVLLAGVVIVVVLVRLLDQGLAQRALAHVGSPSCGPQCAVYTSTGPVSSSATWPWLALVGGVVMALSGLLVAVRGPRWAALSSAYDAPAARATEAPVTDKGVWDALDRGDDPT